MMGNIGYGEKLLVAVSSGLRYVGCCELECYGCVGGYGAWVTVSSFCCGE